MSEGLTVHDVHSYVVQKYLREVARMYFGF
jgi:hypothetical protein